MTNPNDTAYPATVFTSYDGERFERPTSGMTIREKFAAMAMQELMSTVDMIRPPLQLAKEAAEYADALILELSKGEK